MGRAIDGELLELEIANIANKLAKSDAQKALMGRVMYCVEHMPTLTPPNEPLTLGELRGMNGPVWVACEPIEGGDGYWCLCRYGTITTPAATVFDAGEIPHWVFYRRPPEVSP